MRKGKQAFVAVACCFALFAFALCAIGTHAFNFKGFGLSVGCSPAKVEDTPAGREQLIRQTLVISDAERARLKTLSDAGVLSVTPVALPIGKHLLGNNRHLGWPVGIKSGGTLLCAYQRGIRHHGRDPKVDNDSSGAVLTRSEDGGKTWSGPVDMRSYGVSKDPIQVYFSCLVLPF